MIPLVLIEELRQVKAPITNNLLCTCIGTACIYMFNFTVSMFNRWVIATKHVQLKTKLLAVKLSSVVKILIKVQ